MGMAGPDRGTFTVRMSITSATNPTGATCCDRNALPSRRATVHRFAAGCAAAHTTRAACRRRGQPAPAAPRPPARPAGATVAGSPLSPDSRTEGRPLDRRSSSRGDSGGDGGGDACFISPSST